MVRGHKSPQTDQPDGARRNWPRSFLKERPTARAAPVAEADSAHKAAHRRPGVVKPVKPRTGTYSVRWIQENSRVRGAATSGLCVECIQCTGVRDIPRDTPVVVVGAMRRRKEAPHATRLQSHCGKAQSAAQKAARLSHPGGHAMNLSLQCCTSKLILTAARGWAHRSIQAACESQHVI